MDGLTLLGQLNQLNYDLRAVIVTAYGDMKNIRTAMNRGAFDFVTKPIDFDDLDTTIAKTLEHLRVMRDALRSRDELVALRKELGVAARMQDRMTPALDMSAVTSTISSNLRTDGRGSWWRTYPVKVCRPPSSCW